jgi:hypothetical protein
MDYFEKYAKHTGRPDWAEQLAILPDHMVAGMVRYLVWGIPPGSFLGAVLSGDLFGALRRADGTNMNALPAYGRFLINYAPSGSYGSPDRVAAWLREGGLNGMAEAAEVAE